MDSRNRVCTALYWFDVRHCHISSFWLLLGKHDIKRYDFAFACALFDLLHVVLSERCLVDEGILVGFAEIDETIFVLDVKPFHG